MAIPGACPRGAAARLREAPASRPPLTAGHSTPRSSGTEPPAPAVSPTSSRASAACQRDPGTTGQMGRGTAAGSPSTRPGVQAGSGVPRAPSPAPCTPSSGPAGCWRRPVSAPPGRGGWRPARGPAEGDRRLSRTVGAPPGPAGHPRGRGRSAGQGDGRAPAGTSTFRAPASVFLVSMLHGDRRQRRTRFVRQKEARTAPATSAITLTSATYGPGRWSTGAPLHKSKSSGLFFSRQKSQLMATPAGEGSVEP